MRLKRILLENVCQFSGLDHVFHPGLTGIIGPNGSGKSNLTKAIYFALTGTYRNAGVKAANVSQVGKGKRAAATLWFEHDGIEAVVVRGLAGVTTKLEIKGDPHHVVGDVAATEAIMEILGVDAKLLGEYVFILQLHMTDFIEATPGDRAKVFQRLFGTDECEAINGFASKLLDKELAVVEQADLPAIRARLDQNGVRMSSLLDRLEELDERVATCEATEEACLRVVADAEWCDDASEELSRVTRQVAALAEDASAAAKVRDEATAELARLEAALESVGEDAQAARVSLATWRTIEARRARAKVLARRRERLEADLEENRRPEKSPALTQEESARREFLRAERQRLERLTKLAHAGVAECPTCGQAVPGEVADAAALSAKAMEALAAMAILDAKENAHLAYVGAKDAWDRWRYKHAQDMSELVEAEAALDAEAEDGPDADPAILQGIIDAEAGLRESIRKLRARHAAASASAERASGGMEGAATRHQDLAKELAARLHAPELVRKSMASLGKLSQARAERERAEGECAELGRNLAADEELLARLVEVDRKNAFTASLRSGLQQVVDVTHRNAAPRLVSEAHLDRLIDDVDENLEMFGADFRVRLGAGLSFVADFVDGRSQAADRLSEGQKGVLALAFWVAVNSLFARQVGFLSLDEPTSSLDQQNIGALEVALKQLRELSESVGLQCLLVTHEQSLSALFDSVLQL